MTSADLRNVLLLSGCMVTAFSVLTREAWSLLWLRYATYFTLILVTGVWLFRWTAWARARWSSPLAALRANGAEILLALAAMTLLFATHDWQFKVFSDETSLTGTARSFAMDRRFDVPGESHFYHGAHHFFDYGFDKRPPLFAFVLSLVDTLIGYRPRNAWLLNGALLGGVVLVVAGALRPRLGRPWSLLAALWAIANPVVMQTASAAGVEPLLCFLWAIAGVLVLEVLESPESPSFPLLIATLVLLALTRMEAGPMAAIMVGAAVLASPERRTLVERIRADALVWCSPVVAMPLVIQRSHLDYLQGSKASMFSFAHAAANVKNWATILGDRRGFYPFDAIVMAVEIVAVVALVVLVLSRRSQMSRAEHTAFIVFSTVTAGFAALYSAYFWGQPTDPVCARFYALPLFFAGLAVPAVLLRLDAVRARPGVAVMVSAMVFVHAFPAAHNRAFANTIGSREQHKIVTDFLRPRIPGRTVLLVSVFPGHFHIYDVGAITFATFNRERAALLREVDRHRYDDVFIVQDISLQDGKPRSGSVIEGEVQLEMLEERRYDGASMLRISRLVGGATEATTSAPSAAKATAMKPTEFPSEPANEPQ